MCLRRKLTSACGCISACGESLRLPASAFDGIRNERRECMPVRKIDVVRVLCAHRVDKGCRFAFRQCIGERKTDDGRAVFDPPRRMAHRLQTARSAKFPAQPCNMIG